MEEKNYKKIAKTLSMALIDDFRGFLVEGVQRIKVPDDMLHVQIALQEMMKIPGWHHESGVGEDPIVELMKDKSAIYITKIPDAQKEGVYYRSIGYVKDVYSDIFEYKGKKMHVYEMLRRIAIGMGYDVDEYTLLERTENSVKTPFSVVNYKGSIYVKKSQKMDIQPHKNLSEGDIPVFDNNNRLIGFKSKGEFVAVHHYTRYSNEHHNNKKTADSFDPGDNR